MVKVSLATLLVLVIFRAFARRASPEWGVQAGYGFTVHLNIGR